MAFPTIPTTGAGRVLVTTQADTSATRTFPSLSSLTKNSGDLLIAIIVCYQTSTGTNAAFSSWGGGFTEFHDSATSTTLAMGAAWKISDGTETGTFSVTQAATITGHAAMILLSIPGTRVATAPEAGSRASGTTSAANPAAFDPAGWDAEDTLWIAVGGSGETSTTGSYTGLASAPANYGDYVDTGISADVVGGVEAAVAFRQINAASENVATFGLDTSNARNGAFVIAIRPAISATLGQVEETDLAQAITVVQVYEMHGIDSVVPSQLVLADPVYPEDVELVFGAAGQDVGVGQASETDLAQALTAAKAKTIAQAAETDEALALTAGKAATLGQALETDEAQAVSSGLAVAVLQATETDLAQAITSAKARAIAQASETDLAQPVSGGIVGEALDGVDSIAPSQLLLVEPVYPEDVELVFAAAGLDVGVGQAVETDLAQALTSAKAKQLGQASETDEAQGVTSGLAAAISQATETDEAQALTSAKAKALGQAAETDSAQAIAAQQAGAQAELIDNLEAEDSSEAYEEPTQAGIIVAVSAPPADQTVGVNQASETDSAQALGKLKSKAIAQASESDSAQALGSGKAATLGQAAEADSALAVTVTGAKVIAIGQASETDSAQGITWSPKIRIVGQATELDEAQAVSAGGIPLGQATEADSAQALVVVKRVVLGQAAETDAAQGVGRAKVAHLLQAFESDSAQQILPAGAYAIGQASETDEAQPITPVRVDYDWDPRGRIGSRRGRDRWERIGSSKAKDASGGIGKSPAKGGGRIGSGST